MVNDRDVFGKALLDYYHGNADACLKVFSTEAETYNLPVSVFFRPPDQLTIDRLAVSLCSGKILDIGAGTGIHTLYLQNKGVEVTALDVSRNACLVMSHSGVKNIINQDIFELESESKYETWLILGRSIGAVGNLEKLRNFFLKAKLSLTPRGKIILNSTNGERNITIIRKLQFEYQGTKSSIVDWLNIDRETLQKIAYDVGFAPEIVHIENDGNYLAVLRQA
ncbi:methyltransferase domain-containing protein [Pleurocapsa sp. PCC 7319]|uniref:methyltransferase domain-containing protein n=1 Tax=Pleurocapsa sp. PCC 7319 TaxID=118161 RepID=UPI000346E19A|nr:methyltransferase domain-containing protein [Pleurocapsa sp. PCC 7319]